MHPPIDLLKLKQNLKSETLTNGPKEKNFIKTLTTTPYTSAWNLIIKHIGVTRRGVSA